MAKVSTRPMVQEFNMETNEVIDSEMNDVEFAQYEADQARQAAAAEAKAKTEADKAALLARLGITDKEAKLLLS